MWIIRTCLNYRWCMVDGKLFSYDGKAGVKRYFHQPDIICVIWKEEKTDRFYHYENFRKTHMNIDGSKCLYQFTKFAQLDVSILIITKFHQIPLTRLSVGEHYRHLKSSVIGSCCDDIFLYFMKQITEYHDKNDHWNVPLWAYICKYWILYI